MKSFTLIVQSATQTERIEGVSSFVGEDASGSFGIRANHTRMITSLVFGLARFRVGDQPWKYLALPGAVLYFLDNELFLSTRSYLIDDNYEKISALLQQQLLKEEEELRMMKAGLRNMEEEILRRMWVMGREGGFAG
jgi:F-type H+-transporting ATPase subunit epsilon